jgi:methionyl-tRNA formyltransferase
MRIVFAGTPEFAVSSLRAAARHHEVVAVYTQPDRPAGRGRGLAHSPVKLEAVARGIPVYQPESLKDAAAQQQLRDLQPDLMVVVAYGLILPKAVLAIPTHGCWNVHASLLPRWRGAAPIQRAIQAGDAKTGVCLMQMEAGLDTGPVLLHQELPIASTDTGGQLHDKLAELGAQVLSDGLGLLRAGIKPIARPQPEQGVTYAHKLDKAEARLDWAQDADALARTVRAFNPWPIASTDTGGQLHDKLAELGAQVLSDGLGLLRAGIKPIARPQPEQGVTYAHKLDKAEARLDWAQDADALARTVRAFNPWPIAEATLAGERVRIHGAVALEADHGQAPGTVLAAVRDGIDIACGQGALRLRVLQREGGKAITAADYLNARRDLRVGA